MTNIILPMAGAGKRFSDAGYQISKPALPVFDRRTKKQLPMVVCAAKDLPFLEPDGRNLFLIDRDYHKVEGVEELIQKSFPKAEFLTLSELTQGQACTCLLACECVDLKEPMLIAGCDNGMIFDEEALEHCMDGSDVIAFTYRNDERVLKNPSAFGWILADENHKVKQVSVKKPLSEEPMKDHAVVATFWFRKGEIYKELVNKMIECNDRVNGEFYVDTVMKYAVESGYRTKVFEIEKYIGWGTPEEYEYYQNTIQYWMEFVSGSDFIGNTNE